jgi:hypothetical protein
MAAASAPSGKQQDCTPSATDVEYPLVTGERELVEESLPDDELPAP